MSYQIIGLTSRRHILTILPFDQTVYSVFAPLGALTSRGITGESMIPLPVLYGFAEQPLHQRDPVPSFSLKGSLKILQNVKSLQLLVLGQM